MGKVINLQNYLDGNSKKTLIEDLNRIDFNKPEEVKEVFVMLTTSYVGTIGQIKLLAESLNNVIMQNEKNWADQNNYDTMVNDNVTKLINQISEAFKMIDVINEKL